MAIEQLTQEELESVVSREGQSIRRYVEQLWKTAITDISLSKVQQALIDPTRREQFSELLEAIIRGWGQVYSDGYQSLLADVSKRVARLNGWQWSKGDILLTQEARLSAAQLVREITAQVRGVVREAMVGYVEGTMTREAAADIVRRMVSLTEREVSWTWNRYNKVYDKTLADLRAAGVDPIRAAERAEKLASKAMKAQYRKLHEARVERVVRTEAARLKSKGEINAINQAISSGQIKNATKTWRRTAFNDNHPNSISNDGLTVPVNGIFPDGSPIPQEINERCILEYSYERVTQ